MNHTCPSCQHQFKSARAKRAPSDKPPSEKQLAARENFRQMVVLAKQIKAEHPDWDMKKCHQEAICQLRK